MAANFCPNCGTKIDGANFCPNCGERVADILSAESTTSANQKQPERKPITFGGTSSNQELLKRFGLHSQSETPSKQDDRPTATADSQDNAKIQQTTQTKEPHIFINNEPGSGMSRFSMTPQDPEPPAQQTPPGPQIVKPTPPEPETVPISREEKKKMLNQILDTPTEDTPKEEIRTKRPEKKKAPVEAIANAFFSAGYADEASPNSESKVKIVEDNIYNTSIETDYVEFDDEIEEEKPQKKKTRSANTSGVHSKKASPAIIQKATSVAAKHLIDEDKKLENVQRVYIIEQEEMPDPNDPTYDGYYENTIPIDEVYKEKTEKQRNSLTLNEDTKKTVFVLLGLLAALIIIIFIEFV